MPGDRPRDPYGTPGGTTTESNLATLDRRTHHAKTLDHLRLELGTRRDLTLTTLLDQRRRTRVHDYNQYLRTAHPDDLADRRDLANRAICAHEAHVHRRRRRTRGRTHSPDDDWLTLTHADPDTGGTRYGPHPDTPTLDDVLGISREQEPGDPPGKEARGAGGTGDVP